ncbi:MAG TPA: outer membrane beta-barrel protein [Vicinamibacterales bacterium]
MRKAARIPRALVIFTCAGLLNACLASRANAEGFISPYLGWNFGGDAGCPAITNCEDKHANYGVAFGAVGSIVGFEEEFGFTNDFFGSTPNQSSKVITLMSNFMVAPKLGPVQPYGLAGVGLIRTTVDAVGASDQNQIGWDVGGGVMVFFSQHVGVRGDVRYYHSFQVLDFSNLPTIPGFNPSDKKLDYGRVAGALVFKF